MFLLNKKPETVSKIIGFLKSIKGANKSVDREEEVWKNYVNDKNKNKETLKEIYEKLQKFLNEINEDPNVQKLLNLIPDDKWEEAGLPVNIKFDILVWVPLINSIINDIVSIYVMISHKGNTTNKSFIEKYLQYNNMDIIKKLNDISVPENYLKKCPSQVSSSFCTLQITSIYQQLLSFSDFFQNKFSNQT